MISVAEALDRLFALVAPLPVEQVPLRRACGRVLARDAVARRDQPPFAASAMDGYAVIGDQVAPGARFTVIGEAPAGKRYSGSVGPGQAVRIFTGAPVPDGATRIVIQEDVQRQGNVITLGQSLDSAAYIRAQGTDFTTESVVITKGSRLGPSEVSLLAAMNLPVVTVYQQAEVAVICTGDELVMPGEIPDMDQIIVSNGFGLAAMAETAGATCRLLPIAADNAASLTQAFELARGADLIVTSGGASVGDHDLVADVARSVGATLDFEKLAMRPGKPVMAGRLGDSTLIGLPGNPVSSMVCGAVFMLPMLNVLHGLPPRPAARRRAPLSTAVPANGPREHYMRAVITNDGIAPLPRQDSALLSVLAAANALLIRPVADPARDRGEFVEYLPL